MALALVLFPRAARAAIAWFLHDNVLTQEVECCRYVDEQFGGVEQLRKDILIDFFRSAFDGSGADNFYDAVSPTDRHP